jgi:hypothetical protein
MVTTLALHAETEISFVFPYIIGTQCRLLQPAVAVFGVITIIIIGPVPYC